MSYAFVRLQGPVQRYIQTTPPPPTGQYNRKDRVGVHRLILYFFVAILFPSNVVIPALLQSELVDDLATLYNVPSPLQCGNSSLSDVATSTTMREN